MKASARVPFSFRGRRYELEEFGVDPRVVAEFRVEGCGHNFPLTDEDRVAVTLGEDLNA
jgi:hypothetical protein